MHIFDVVDIREIFCSLYISITYSCTYIIVKDLVLHLFQSMLRELSNDAIVRICMTKR